MASVLTPSTRQHNLSIMLLPLLLVWLLPSTTDGVRVSIERGVVPSIDYIEDEEWDQQCDYAGQITMAHPSSLDVSDRFYTLSSQMLIAAHMSLDAINLWPRCGVHLPDGNYSLHLSTYGDSSSVNKTRAIGKAIVNQTDFMLAGYSSTLSKELAPTAQANGRLLLTAGSAITDIYENRDHVFALLPPFGSYTYYAFRGLVEQGAKSASYISEEDACGGIREMAEDTFNMTFLNATTLPKYASYQTYLQVAESFKNQDPDVVVMCVRTELANFMLALRETKWQPRAIVYTMVPGTKEFEEAIGPTNLPFLMGVSSWVPELPPIPDGATGWTPTEFGATFEKATLRRPTYHAVPQSAAISVLVQAMERVGGFQNTTAVKNEIATGHFATVYGNVSFDANGQSAAPSLLFQYDAQSAIHVLLPTSLKFGLFNMVYPMPSFDYRDCEIVSDCAVSNGTCAADGTCDCQYYDAISHGRGPTAECVTPPPATQDYLGVALSLPIAILLLVVGLVLFVYNKRVVNSDDSVWKIQQDELKFEVPHHVIGRGTFGVVVLAEYHGTKVAVKQMLPPHESKSKIIGMKHPLNTTSFETNQTVSTTGTKMITPSKVIEPQETFQDDISGSNGDSNDDDDENDQQQTRSVGTASADSAVLSNFTNDNSEDNNSKRHSVRVQLRHNLIEEMRNLYHLRHPNIITVLGAVVDSAVEPMLVMEYMQHGSLYSMLHNETMPIDDELLLPILRDVSSGCRFLHAADPVVLHGDLKSANILVDDRLRAKIADFGMAAIRRKPGATGTPFWMAPELLGGSSLNSRATDVYSFGMILWECSSRKDPFEGDNEDTQTILAQIADPKINRRPTPPKDCPPQLASLMADCFSSDPAKRPSFEEVDIRLERMEARTEQKSSSVSLFDIFPRHVAEALRDGKKVEPEHKDQVTIFFSDIVNYTQISSELDPRKVASMLDRLYHKFDELSHLHQVFKVETIGDAYMAVTNLVKDQQEDHAVRIASFAVDAIKAANDTLIDPDNPEKGTLSIRCGFHSGPVVADVVGSRNPRYCLFGDTVNTASRMESNSKKNKILCSNISAEILQEQGCDLKIAQRGNINVKGKGAMVVYWILEKHGAVPRESFALITTAPLLSE